MPPSYVSKSQESQARNFVVDAMLLMNIVGIKFFEEKNNSLRRRLLEGTRKKAKAINYLKATGVVLGENVYYCSNATNHGSFFVDVDKHVADECKWTPIINNVAEKKLYVAFIPAGMIEGIKVRSDTDKYTIRFKASDYTIKRINLCLRTFAIQEIGY